MQVGTLDVHQHKRTSRVLDGEKQLLTWQIPYRTFEQRELLKCLKYRMGPTSPISWAPKKDWNVICKIFFVLEEGWERAGLAQQKRLLFCHVLGAHFTSWRVEEASHKIPACSLWTKCFWPKRLKRRFLLGWLCHVFIGRRVLFLIVQEALSLKAMRPRLMSWRMESTNSSTQECNTSGKSSKWCLADEPDFRPPDQQSLKNAHWSSNV